MEIVEEREKKGEFVVKIYRSGIVYLGCKKCKITSKGVEVEECVKYLPYKTRKVSEENFDAFLDEIRKFDGTLTDLEYNISKISRYASYKVWRRNNPEYKRKWNAAHREVVNQSYRRWLDKNRDKYYAYQRAHKRAKKLERAQELARRLEK